MSVTYKPLMLGVMLNVKYKPFMLSVIMLSATYKWSSLQKRVSQCTPKWLGDICAKRHLRERHLRKVGSS